ncbi:MAG: hypothetical protein Q7J31_13535 [Syntrophales bacterium]|nr:hypothetical protein [Syntrophales bacterium]
MARRAHDFQTIRSEGGLLPPDLLRRVLDPKEKLDGARPEDYGLLKGERLNEVITQSWTRMHKYWAEFRDVAAKLPEGEPGTGLTNDKWNLPLLRELGFGLLPTTAGPEIGGRTYAVNRFFGPVPIHLIGCGLSLDRRTAGVRGAATINPHGLVQELLNRSDAYLWAIVSNGLCLRLLRDNQALSRQSFLEFDIEAMFDGEVYSDFVLLWLMAHATRFAPRDAERPESCWLEQWAKLAEEQGTRALGDLRQGVERALQILGEGFTGHPKNMALRDLLRSGQVSLTDFHCQLQRIVYRLIFLFVAEDRTLDGLSLLHPRDDSDTARLARERYTIHYSTARLRDMAARIKGSRHGDLWQQFQLLVMALSGNDAFAAAREQLALPALGSFLWDPDFTAALKDAELTNHDFLEALRNLAFTRQGNALRPVDYKNHGAEELGGVYESLLDLTPQISADGARFTFAEFAGSERKTSGSYYTHDLLVQCLLDSALDPVVEEAIKGKTGAEAEEAILALKVCDSAVGSGHFLVGAGHRLARHLARVRALAQGDSEPSPLLYQHALRDVIGRCLYGVDINPMAAELCRVSLWLESLEPGKPLSFLDHHIRVGNSLIGATPELIAAGLPDATFTPIEGDDKKMCAALKKRNKQEREGGQRDLLHLMVAEPQEEYNAIGKSSHNIENAPDDTLDEIERKADQFRKLVVSPEYQHAQQVADAWCAAFVWQKKADVPFEPLTTDSIRRLIADPKALTIAQHHEVERLSRQYQFFHWHLAFPEVFVKGGFDCHLGNPPWEKITTIEREFFSAIPEIVQEKRSDRRKAQILSLRNTDPVLYERWIEQLRFDTASMHFLRTSDHFPLSAVGELNLYPLFVELADHLIDNYGAVGIIIKTGMMLSPTWAEFTSYLIDKDRIVSAFDFRNWKGWFPGIGYHERFTLLTMKKGRQKQDIVLGYYLDDTAEIRDASKTFTIARDEAIRLNPITKTLPAFESSLHKTCVMAVYDRFPVLGDKASEWGVHYTTGLHMAAEADKLRDFEELSAEGLDPDEFLRMKKEGLTFIPLYEGKFIHQFDHRFASFEGISRENRFGIKAGTHNPTTDQKKDPAYHITPRYWISEEDAAADRESRDLRSDWAIAFRDTTNVISNFRTSVACICSGVAFNYKAPNIVLNGPSTQERAKASLLFVTLMNSFPFDYVVRQKFFGANFIKSILLQLAAPSMTLIQHHQSFIMPRALELSYTSQQLEGFAAECGFKGQPFIWDEIRRQHIRAELDALFFHIYGFSVDDAAFILESYRILRERDEASFGEYRTKRLILDIYNKMAETTLMGTAYQTRLDPPPADPRCCHPPKNDMG